MSKFAVVIVLVLVAVALGAQSVGDELAVAVRGGELRSQPGFLSPITGGVVYGQTVVVRGTQGDWVRVDADGVEGWLHGTAVAPPREMNLVGAGDRETGTTSREIALAGRGFNEQVEEQYREEQDLDFSAVDAMEEAVLPVAELTEFLAEIGAEIREEDE